MPRYHFIQVNCKEEDRIDLRQARAVLKYKPNLIFLEYPKVSNRPISEVPRFPKEVLLKNPWARSDKYMWANISKLWKEKHNALVYAVDGPYDLVNKANIYPCNEKYPNKTTNLFWWIRIYLREYFMADNIKAALQNYKAEENPTILVFLQKFHWEHVEFLLSNPHQSKIWNFYFGRFRDLDPSEISSILKKENPILYKYWKKYPI